LPSRGKRSREWERNTTNKLGGKRSFGSLERDKRSKKKKKKGLHREAGPSSIPEGGGRDRGFLKRQQMGVADGPRPDECKGRRGDEKTFVFLQSGGTVGKVHLIEGTNDGGPRRFAITGELGFVSRSRERKRVAHRCTYQAFTGDRGRGGAGVLFKHATLYCTYWAKGLHLERNKLAYWAPPGGRKRLPP